MKNCQFGSKVLQKKLYNWIIKPIADELGKKKIRHTLLIVPSRQLLRLPFVALINEEQKGQYLQTGKYLLEEDYAVVTLLSWKLTNSSIPIEWNKEKALLNGLIAANKEGKTREVLPSSESELSNVTKTMRVEEEKLEERGEERGSGVSCVIAGLPNGQTEIEEIGKTIDSNNGFYERLLGKQFTIEMLKNKVKNTNYSIIHFATHGEFKEKSDESFLHACDGELTLDDMEEMFRGQEVKLLTLSACQTALGAELGMAGVGIKAGTRSVLGTLWKVEDESSFLLMKSFYQNLRDSSMAQALKKSQLQLLAGNFKSPLAGDFKSPYYWSGFLLIGNWLK